MSGEWEIAGWVLPNENMTPYLCDIDHIYRIIVPLPGNPDRGHIHHLPLGAAGIRGVLVRRPAFLPQIVPGAVRDRPCSLAWRERRR